MRPLCGILAAALAAGCTTSEGASVFVPSGQGGAAQGGAGGGGAGGSGGSGAGGGGGTTALDAAAESGRAADGAAGGGPDGGRALSTNRDDFFGPSRCAGAGVLLCEDFESGTIDTKRW